MKWINYDFADKTFYKGRREIPQALLVTVAAIILIYLLGV